MFDRERAEHFNRVAKTSFAPIYPVIAEQILQKTEISEGRCIDLGSGPGSLAIAVARLSGFTVWSLDLSPSMTAIATENIDEASLLDRVFPLTGDVQSLPFADESFDLVVSRGSMFFWKDKKAAFSEIYRIIRPGGWACVGGGFGTRELAEKIKRGPGGRPGGRRSGPRKGERRGPEADRNPENYHIALKQAGIEDYDLRKDESGFWITIHKPSKIGLSSAMGKIAF